MQPEIAIDSWRQWQTELPGRPVILGPLSGGCSNQSFLLDAGGKRMVLRLNNTDSLLPTGNHSTEASTWQAASKQGIAPPLLHVDKQYRYLVSTFIQTTLPAQPEQDQGITGQALDLIKRTHRLQVEAPTIDYHHHIESYWQTLEAKTQAPDPALLAQREPMQAALDTLISSGTPTGLCHHDPVTANFVGNPTRLYLIDWEYAAIGLQVMDYAALATEWEIKEATILAHTDLTPAQLAGARSLYTYLCTLWNELNSPCANHALLTPASDA